MGLNNFRTEHLIWDRVNSHVTYSLETNSGDSNGRKLRVQVLDGGVVTALTGVTLSLAWKTGNERNSGLDAFKIVDAALGIFEIYYTTEMLSNVGKLKASLVLVDATGRMESDTFSITVNPTMVNDNAVQGENSFTALTEALVNINNVNEQLSKKPNKGEVSIDDFDKNLGKFDQTFMTDEFLKIIAGNAPINSTPAKESITFDQTTFLKVYYENMVNKETITDGYLDASGNVVASQDARVSDFIPVINGKIYKIPLKASTPVAGPWSGHVYGASKNDLGRIATPNAELSITSTDVKFVKLVWLKGSSTNVLKDTDLMMVEGTVYPTEYIPHIPKLKTTSDMLQELFDEIPEKSVGLSNTTFLKEEHTNLIDKSKIKKGFYINDSGVPVSNPSSSVSDYTPFESGKIYSTPLKYISETANVWSSYAYDANKKPIGRIFPTNKKLTSTNTNIKFIILAWQHSSYSLTDMDLMMVEGDKYPVEYIPYVDDEIGFTDPEMTKAFARKLAPYIDTQDELDGLTWAVTGDSITAPLVAYHTFAAEILGLRVLNYGIGETSMAYRPGRTDSLSERYMNMSNEADIITEMSGTNDGGATIGTMADRTNATFFGACHVVYKGLVEKYPGKRIGVILMLPRDGYRNNSHFWQRIEAKKEVAHYYGIPVLDLTNESGIAIEVPSLRTLYMPDGLHPSVEGHKIIARRVAAFLKSL